MRRHPLFQGTSKEFREQRPGDGWKSSRVVGRRRGGCRGRGLKGEGAEGGGRGKLEKRNGGGDEEKHRPRLGVCVCVCVGLFANEHVTKKKERGRQAKREVVWFLSAGGSSRAPD